MSKVYLPPGVVFKIVKQNIEAVIGSLRGKKILSFSKWCHLPFTFGDGSTLVLKGHLVDENFRVSVSVYRKNASMPVDETDPMICSFGVTDYNVDEASWVIGMLVYVRFKERGGSK